MIGCFFLNGGNNTSRAFTFLKWCESTAEVEDSKQASGQKMQAAAGERESPSEQMIGCKRVFLSAPWCGSLLYFVSTLTQ